MNQLHCRRCFQTVLFQAGPCARCGEANPIGFRRSLSTVLQALAVMLIAVCIVWLGIR